MTSTYNMGGALDHSIDIGMPYGEMPADALVSKFEETAVEYNEGTLLEDYQREALMDRREDPRTLESDAPRRNHDSQGFLNHRYTGTRSGQEVAHPEIFLGLTEKDPRRTATDPDYNKLREQFEGRTRFVRFSADADNSITGGGWRENQVQAAKQELFKQQKDRWKIFDTGYDGRREGLKLPKYPRKSDIQKVVHDSNSDHHDHVDMIADAALVPQRKTTIMSNKLIRNTREYHQFTTDHKFKIAKYGDNPRKSRTLGPHASKINTADTETEFEDTDLSVAYKSIAYAMGDIVKSRHKNTEHDAEYATSKKHSASKSKKMVKDLVASVAKSAHDSKFRSSMKTKNSKTPHRHKQKSSVYGMNLDNSKPAHHKLNAKLMYKSVKGSKDNVKIKHEMITNDKKGEMIDYSTQSRKTGKRKVTQYMQSKMNTTGKSMKSAVYKTNDRLKDQRKIREKAIGQHVQLDSDVTKVKKTNVTNYRNPKSSDTVEDRKYNDNTKLERYTAPVGTKYTAGLIDRDGLQTPVFNK